MLRDRLICGINDTAMQRKLLSEGETLSLSDALKVALSMEVAFKDSQELPHAAQSIKSEPINSIQRAVTNRRVQNSKRSRQTPAYRGNHETKEQCYRCLGQNHSADVCHFKREKCFNCQKVGHTKRACRSTARTTTQGQSK